MVKYPQASSEEDHDVASLRFTTPREILAWVDTQDQVRGSEWLIALYLGAHGEVLGLHPIFDGEQCGMDPEPLLTPMLAHATTLHTASLLTVRRHNHRWMGHGQVGQAQITRFETRVHDAGIRWLGCLVQDSKGILHTLMFDQQAGVVGGKSGSSGPTSRPR